MVLFFFDVEDTDNETSRWNKIRIESKQRKKKKRKPQISNDIITTGNYTGNRIQNNKKQFKVLLSESTKAQRELWGVASGRYEMDLTANRKKKNYLKLICR